MSAAAARGLDPISGERREIHDPKAGRISYSFAGPAEATLGEASNDDRSPLLLIHSINAAASAHEIKPLYDAFKFRRPTYAVDLPGYGFSERSDREYVPRLMTDALHAVIREIRAENHARPVNALAVSLSCEFLARAAVEAPESIRSLALVSPTGFRRRMPRAAPGTMHCGRKSVYRILNLPLFGRALFRILTTTPSVRFFLRKTWGGKRIDSEMLQNSVRSCRAPGARHAPFHFLSGYLFSADIQEIFQSLDQPVWLAHGVRGGFTDFSRTEHYRHAPNWRIEVFQTGALPYFEVTEAFVEAYSRFLDSASRA